MLFRSRVEVQRGSSRSVSDRRGEKEPLAALYSLNALKHYRRLGNEFQIFMFLIMLGNKTSNINWIRFTVFQFDFCFLRVIEKSYDNCVIPSSFNQLRHSNICKKPQTFSQSATTLSANSPLSAQMISI